MHKLLWYFEIQTDHLISARQADIIINNNNKKSVELKKTMEHESDGDNNCNRCSWYSHRRIGTGNGGLGNEKTSEDHPNYDIVAIGQNTEKSPGNFRTLAVTQTLMKDHHLTLMGKTLKV